VDRKTIDNHNCCAFREGMVGASVLGISYPLTDRNAIVPRTICKDSSSSSVRIPYVTAEEVIILPAVFNKRAALDPVTLFNKVFSEIDK